MPGNKHRHRFRRRSSIRDTVLPDLLRTQSNEITEWAVYAQLARLTSEPKARKTLSTIALEEKKHADFWSAYTQRDTKPNRLMVYSYLFMARLFGLTFALKLMEKGERLAQVNYRAIAGQIPEASAIEQEEEAHEEKLLSLLDEEKLKYIGSMVLGVNDALVELTGALAGLTFAFQNTKLIAVTGLITGIAASLSMAGSEYLSTIAEEHDKNPVKAAVYTGIMYVVTVLLLILPYYLIPNVFAALSLTLAIAVGIIFLFTFYISIAQDKPFRKRFLEMVSISFGVSAITFVIGLAIRHFFGIVL